MNTFGSYGGYQNNLSGYRQTPYAPYSNPTQRLQELERMYPQYAQPQQNYQPQLPPAGTPQSSPTSLLAVSSIDDVKNFIIPPERLTEKFIFTKNLGAQDEEIFVKYVDPATYSPVMKQFVSLDQIPKPQPETITVQEEVTPIDISPAPVVEQAPPPEFTELREQFCALQSRYTELEEKCIELEVRLDEFGHKRDDAKPDDSNAGKK